METDKTSELKLLELTKVQEIFLTVDQLKSVLSEMHLDTALLQLDHSIAPYRRRNYISAAALLESIGVQRELRILKALFMTEMRHRHNELLRDLLSSLAELEALQRQLENLTTPVAREVWALTRTIVRDLLLSYHEPLIEDFDELFREFQRTPRDTACGALGELGGTGSFWYWYPELREGETLTADYGGRPATHEDASQILTAAYRSKVARLLELLPQLVDASGEPLWS